MGQLLFLLLWGLHKVWGSSDVLQRAFPFHMLQISSFPNSSHVRTDCLAWLGELQTHRWRNESDTIQFLKPWSMGTFSQQQVKQLQQEFLVYRLSVFNDVQKFSKLLKLTYPIELQVFAGCEVHPGNVSESYFHVAFQGSLILSFQGTSYKAAPDVSPKVDVVVQELNKDPGTSAVMQVLMNYTCPQFVRGIIEAGKSDLEKQVKPEAWLSSGPSPGPGRLLLVCRVSGFYPKPVWAKWMRGEQEQPAQQGDILPNADETWHLRVTVDVESKEAAGLSCRVKHSSLGDQDIILYWDGSRIFWIWIWTLVVLGCLLIVGLVCFRRPIWMWLKRHCSYEDIP
ncbi:antigen-presenting glycoprotein CD1d-like [Ochotona princeps]|uniref:antigen-presenting glycoprotein CD1d-like n=1 Tax=Ochotona princeps TaxID=9978 RepID=UPI002714DA09|nr:antigen-presenting glycoprotein CD1d-like [Ochotona princeps]